MKLKLHYLIVAMLFSCFIKAQTVSVSITGTGTGGWNQPGAVALTSTDGVTYSKTNFEIVGDGNMKFSEAADWGTTYGFNSATTASGFPDGVAGANAPGFNNNIVGTLGFWSVTYNIATKAYAFTPGINPNSIIKINSANNDSFYTKKLILAIPPINLNTIVEKSSANIKELFNNNLALYSRETAYIDNISITFHWNFKLNLNKLKCFKNFFGQSLVKVITSSKL